MQSLRRLGFKSSFISRYSMLFVLTFVFLVTGAEAQSEGWYKVGSFPYSTETNSERAIARDRGRDRLILVGSPDGRIYPGLIHEWDGIKWYDIYLENWQDVPGSYRIAAWDPATGMTLCVSKAPSGVETWGWDGKTWKLINHCQLPLFPGRMVPDPPSERVYLVTAESIWAWNGKAWSFVAKSAAKGLVSWRAAFDESRSVLVIVGDTGTRMAVFELHNGKMIEMNGSKAASPPRRRLFSFAYSSQRSACILYGGESPYSYHGGQLFADTWEWDGSHWRRIPVTRHPGYRISPTLVPHPTRPGLVLLGGLSPIGSRPEREIWWFSAPAGMRRRLLGKCRNVAGGVPRLWADTRPVIGYPVGVIEENGPPNSVTILVVGGKDPNLSLDRHGMSGCFLRVLGRQYYPLITGPNGRWALKPVFRVPFDYGLVGGAVYLQSIVPSSGANRVGLVLSDGLKLILGL